MCDLPPASFADRYLSKMNGLYRSRTDTPFRAQDFESSASANSAIRAWKEMRNVAAGQTLSTEFSAGPVRRADLWMAGSTLTPDRNWILQEAAEEAKK